VRVSHRNALALVVAVVLSMSLTLSAASPALCASANSAIKAKRKQADVASRRLEDLQAQVELCYEEHAQIEESLAQTRQRISIVRSQLDDATKELARSRRQLEARATTIYRSGSVDLVAVFVGAADFNDFVTRFDLMRRIGRSDAALVSAVKDAKAKVEGAQTSLETREAEQVALRQQARDKQQQYQTASTEQQKYVASLKSQLKKLIVQERARQQRIADARAAAAAAKARAAGKGTGSTFDEGKLGAAHSEVVAVAKRYLGVPYVWGGTSPSGFDCSGLCQYSYQKIGISIPRTSREQFKIGTYIPPDRQDALAKGDLVFFGYNGDPGRVHHVGIYAGGGDFIEAPAAGLDVCVSSLTGRISARGDYVGAVRP
jgi:peptidoglycan DL-endopeptidase CwlO